MTFSAGTYTLTNVKAGVALDLSGGDNQSVIAFSIHGGPNQQVHVPHPVRIRTI
jgi:hypothetical protein